MRKSFLRRRTSRRAQARLLAPKGGGNCSGFVSRVAFWRRFFKIVTSTCVLTRGFRLGSSYIARLDRTYTRRAGLRAANMDHPVGVLSLLFLCRRLSSLSQCSFVLSRVFSRVLGWPGVSSFSFLLFSFCLSLAVDLCVWFGSCLLFLLSAVKLFVRPRVSLSPFCVCVGGPRVSRQALSCGFAWRVGECWCSWFLLFLSMYIS